MSLFDTYLQTNEPSLLKAKAARFMALCKALQSPVHFLQGLFTVYSNLRRYDLSHNGQIIYLEKVLNDKLDATQRRIYIDDPQPSNITPTVLYRKSEAQPTAILYRKSEAQTTSILFRYSEVSSIDFVVFIPVSLGALSNQIIIKSLVNFYRVAGKRFTIQTV
jgi:hypothetical protein